MTERTSPLFFTLLSRLKYVHKYVIICTLFVATLIPMTYSFIKTYREKKQILNTALEGNAAQDHLRILLQYLLLHLRLSDIDHGDQPSLQNDTLDLNAHIDEQIRQLNGIFSKESDFRSNDIIKKVPEEDPEEPAIEDLSHNWDSLNRSLHVLTPEKNKAMHLQLIKNIQNELHMINSDSKLIPGMPRAAYDLSHTTLIDFPKILETTDNLTRLGVNVLKTKTISIDQQRAIVLYVTIINSALDHVKTRIARAVAIGHLNETESEHMQQIKSLVEQFINDAETMIEDTNKKILEAEDLTYSPDDYQKIGGVIIEKGFNIWNLVGKETHTLLKEQMDQITFQYYLILILTFLLIALIFSIGLAITYEATKRINQITEAAEMIRRGDFSARVPVTYQDEIGQFGIVFNQMAQKVDQIINKLKILVFATNSLSSGDLAARIPIAAETDEEFKRVAFAFNEMAETYENSMNQLHKLALNLTATATEIAMASKEQEIIFIEQEASTREISLVANEISSTTKEFATTLGEVHVVAEGTSVMARTGQDELSKMEVVMGQMVEAASTIVSRLSVLNEKAGNIKSVITTITNVSDQTNLLSLNAAIEAEKAGEFGRSFSVIAREIRRLADQTAAATLDIEGIIGEITTALSASKEGVKEFTQEMQDGGNQVRKIGEQLAKIIQQVHVLVNSFERVNQGMQIQSSGAEQINAAIAELSQTAQQTSESIHQFRKTVQQLDTASTEIHGVIQRISMKKRD